jgi:hypothetical protein
MPKKREKSQVVWKVEDLTKKNKIAYAIPMVRTIIRPDTSRINLSIPAEYIGEEIEILAFPVNNTEYSVEISELEKMRHNRAFTEKLQQRIKALDEGKGIVKTMAELEALANE